MTATVHVMTDGRYVRIGYYTTNKRQREQEVSTDTGATWTITSGASFGTVLDAKAVIAAVYRTQGQGSRKFYSHNRGRCVKQSIVKSNSQAIQTAILSAASHLSLVAIHPPF